MNINKMLKGAVAALTSAAALGALTAPAFAASGTYDLNGKGVDALSVHGGALRIATIGNAKAKNVILFIGDGMGDSEITVARNYLHGVNGTFQGLDKIGQPGALQTSTGKAADSGVGQYTSFSLGGAVSVDVKGNPQLNLIELAKANGLATGNVTTSEIQDATPAVQESHSSERACYGPQGKWDGTDKNGDGKVDIKDAELAGIGRCLADQLKANGGIGSISEQLLDTRADVTIGGGAKYFNQLDENGNTLWQQAADRGFQTVKSGDVDGFKNLTYKDGQPVLALLGDGNLPTQFNPSVATKQDAAKDENPTVCTTNAKWLGNQGASLADFTDKALDLLQANPKSEKGFFLQVEGASIDKQDHNANACGQIGETDDLDKAISAALKKVDLSDTLIIVTADHAHTSQIVESQPYYALSTVLKNADGSKTTISYGTSEKNLYSDGQDTEGAADSSKAQGNMSHTGTQLRIAASGPGASRVDGLTDQTDNFYTIAGALGLATDTTSQNNLSNGGKVTVNKDKDGKYSAAVTGFNGDAVLSYQLIDNASKKVVAESNTSTPLSGVRVATAATTSISFADFTPAEGASYTLTVNGRQSGKSASVSFPSASGSADKTPNGGNGSGTVAQGTVKEPTVPLGKTGATVLGLALMVLALGAGAMVVRSVKAGRR